MTLLLGSALCGCNSSSAGPPQLEAFPVKGVVTLDGKPLPGAEVVFMTGEPPTICAGRTNDDGSYELHGLAGRDGALQGACKVTISRRVKPDGTPLGPDEAPANVGAAEQLPPKYSRYDASTLSANVPADGGTFDFALTSN
ncbi:MAG TPA: hypothetical protein VNH11_22210 [Pirellulales bacterium]|nr:hypothetical protein [Pirellulales bacterium]